MCIFKKAKLVERVGNLQSSGVVRQKGITE